MYTDYFLKSDTVINHIKHINLPPENYLLRQSYIGFVCIVAVATYEMAIKDILVNFCTKHNPLFGNFFSSKFHRINGNIEIDKIKSNFLIHFGDNYKETFEDMIDFENDMLLQKEHKSLKETYKNIITWRNLFAHSASFNTTILTTLDEVCNSYNIGKNVITCLDIILNEI